MASVGEGMSKQRISTFGGYGFVGGVFCNTYPEHTIRNRRNDYVPRSDRVLYFISTVHNYHVHTNPRKDIQTNLITLVDVLENCRANGVKEFNFISSWFVYGDQELPVSEDACPNPKGFYSITKLCAEQLVQSYCDTFGIKWRILRLSNVLGVGDQKVSKQKNALQWLIQQMVKGEKIELYEGGQFYRDYIDVHDCARAIFTIVNDSSDNGIYNIGNHNRKMFPAYSFGDLIHYIHEASNSESEIVDIEQKDFHKTVQAKSMILDASKLHRLGYTPKYNIYETLDKIIEYEQQNQKHY